MTTNIFTPPCSGLNTKPGIKRIYAAYSADDGIRVLVDRLWPRGIRKTDARIDLWLKDIAPSPGLRKWFDHRPYRFTVFQSEYQLELADNDEAVEYLLDLTTEHKVTLLYAARNPDCNHALVLADYLHKQQ